MEGHIGWLICSHMPQYDVSQGTAQVLFCGVSICSVVVLYSSKLRPMLKGLSLASYLYEGPTGLEAIN